MTYTATTPVASLKGYAKLTSAQQAKVTAAWRRALKDGMDDAGALSIAKNTMFFVLRGE